MTLSSSQEAIEGFVAYPSMPISIGEILEAVIKEINKSSTVRLVSWKQMCISGVPIISEICDQIDRNPLFIADITNHNPNVLFELGYAIARKKRVWLLHDSSTDSARDRFVQVNLLQPIGHTKYTNAHQIITEYYRERPQESLKKNPYAIFVEPIVHQSVHTADVFYLKSFTPTEASSRLSSLIKRSKLKVITDDPSENSAEPLSWYIRHAYGSDGILVHFDSDNVSKASPNNAKYSLVAGFAFGLGKHVLMLAHNPYTCPIDYQLLLRRHDTAAKCIEYAEEWLNARTQKMRKEEHVDKKYRSLLGDREFLSSLTLGEHVAENESETLLEYFIETGPYRDALRANTCLFIGRKGTGKTANLYKIAHELSFDKRNHICLIKPSVYNTEGVLRSLREIRDKAEMGGVFESLWKYLIYSELCLSFYESLKERISFSLTEDEKSFVKYCENNLVSTGDFSVRLEARVDFIVKEVIAKWDKQTAIRLAEHLHVGIIPEMRDKLIKLMRENKRVIILIDNLDKSWRPRDDIRDMSEFLLGLLVVMGNVSSELIKKRDKSGLKTYPALISLVAFLRSDIYSHLAKQAREPDKIHTLRIVWDDADLLLRVIAERLIFANDKLTEEHVWERIFPSQVNGYETKRFIINSIYPRPRDAIVIAKNALSLAISRGHERIREEDLVDARKIYSDYALDSINVENAGEIGTIELGTYALIGCKSILTEEEIKAAFTRDNVNKDLHDNYIKAMCRLSVLGVETAPDNFKFIYDDTTLSRDMKIAEVYSVNSLTRRYKIHSALCPALGIEH